MRNVDWNDKQSVVNYAKSLAGSSSTTMVVYKHPDRPNYNITHLSTFERRGDNPSWIVLRVPPTRSK